MIDITISDDFAAAGVSVTLGCMACSVAVAAAGEGLIAALVREEDRQKAGAAAAGGTSAAAGVARIAAARRAYRALGKDPSRYRPSSEALRRRLAQGKGLYRINNVVDAGNLVSLRTGLAIGAYRLERLAPPVMFRKGLAGETYPAIGRGPLNLEGLPLFADRAGPFGSTTSDSERTMVTPETAGLLMVLIGFGAEPDMAGAVRFTAETLEAYCGAHGIKTAIVSNGVA